MLPNTPNTRREDSWAFANGVYDRDAAHDFACSSDHHYAYRPADDRDAQ